jgi:phage major capsid protein, HK97 family
MNEKERALRQAMGQKQEEIRGLLETDKLSEAEEKTEELRKMKRELDVMRELDLPQVVPPAARGAETVETSAEETEVRGADVLAKLLRGRAITEVESKLIPSVRASAGLNETTGAEGGYIVPVDVQTRINELKRTLNPLDALVRIEPVVTMSGSRVIEKSSVMTAFADVAEFAKLSDTDKPEFVRIEYAIKKYGGILPMSKELLADTDQNLIDYVTRWLAKKDVVTRNAKIVALLKTLTAKPLADVDSIKGVLNVDLDPEIALASVVVTNQDGFNYLDTLKDLQGRYLLQPNPLEPTQKMLFSHPVHVVSNRTLPTETKKVPVFIGSLEDAITLFDRQALSLEGTTVGGQSFERDSFDIKGITRFDVRKVDTEAVVYGQITLA